MITSEEVLMRLRRDPGPLAGGGRGGGRGGGGAAIDVVDLATKVGDNSTITYSNAVTTYMNTASATPGSSFADNRHCVTDRTRPTRNDDNPMQYEKEEQRYFCDQTVKTNRESNKNSGSVGNAFANEAGQTEFYANMFQTNRKPPPSYPPSAPFCSSSNPILDSDKIDVNQPTSWKNSADNPLSFFDTSAQHSATASTSLYSSSGATSLRDSFGGAGESVSQGSCASDSGGDGCRFSRMATGSRDRFSMSLSGYSPSSASKWSDPDVLAATATNFDPFATIHDDDGFSPSSSPDFCEQQAIVAFDPLETIQDDDDVVDAPYHAAGVAQDTVDVLYDELTKSSDPRSTKIDQSFLQLDSAASTRLLSNPFAEFSEPMYYDVIGADAGTFNKSSLNPFSDCHDDEMYDASRVDDYRLSSGAHNDNLFNVRTVVDSPYSVRTFENDRTSAGVSNRSNISDRDGSNHNQGTTQMVSDAHRPPWLADTALDNFGNNRLNFVSCATSGKKGLNQNLPSVDNNQTQFADSLASRDPSAQLRVITGPECPNNVADATVRGHHVTGDGVTSPTSSTSSSSSEYDSSYGDDPLEPFHTERRTDHWSFLLRVPIKKKLIVTSARVWKPVHVRLVTADIGHAREGRGGGEAGGEGRHVIKVFTDKTETEVIVELPLQANYRVCDEGLQQVDERNKCHVITIQRVHYTETISVRSSNLPYSSSSSPPSPSLPRLRDFTSAISNLRQLRKSIAETVPRVSVALQHTPQTIELIKFGGLHHSAIVQKEEIIVDIVDEFFAEFDCRGHIERAKVRVRLFCTAFLSGRPTIEIGLNDERRRGREVVGRRDILPLTTEEWIAIEVPELRPNSSVSLKHFAEKNIIRFQPPDGVRFELMRFRVRPPTALLLAPTSPSGGEGVGREAGGCELPLLVRAHMHIVQRHVRLRAELIVPPVFSAVGARKVDRVPCRDIRMRFPMPDVWVYLFRVERLFRYGSMLGMGAAGKLPPAVKERLNLFTQMVLHPTLIEVSAGTARYEDVFKAIVWTVDVLPERDEDVYKPHVLLLRFDLGPQDTVPDDIDKIIHVEFTMPNSTISHAQVRSMSFFDQTVQSSLSAPEKQVQHLTKYEYRVEMNVSDTANKSRPCPAAQASRSANKSQSTDDDGSNDSSYSNISSFDADDAGAAANEQGLPPIAKRQNRDQV